MPITGSQKLEIRDAEYLVDDLLTTLHGVKSINERVVKKINIVPIQTLLGNAQSQVIDLKSKYGVQL